MAAEGQNDDGEIEEIKTIQQINNPAGGESGGVEEKERSRARKESIIFLKLLETVSS